jgi:hypothetical protein
VPTCPHCSASIAQSAAIRSTKRNPLTCPSCGGNAWFSPPAGAYVFQAIVVAVALGGVRGFGFTGWSAVAIGVVAAVVLSVPLRIWVRRNGWLTPVPVHPSRLTPNNSLERTRER